MASEREKRFQNLERPRREAPEAQAPRAEERFERMESPGSPPAGDGVPEAAKDRFRDPRERPLEVAEEHPGEQPFARCARCEADNSVYAATCVNCGADLRTAEQRAFNERLWAERRAEDAREEAANAERARERERSAPQEAEAQRRYGEALARREAERVREELGGAGAGWPGPGRPGGGWWDPGGWSGGGGYGGSWGGGPPIGLRLLRLIPSPALRIGVAVSAVALPALLVLAGPRGSRVQVAGLVLVFVVLALFVPGGARYRRRPWWW